VSGGHHGSAAAAENGWPQRRSERTWGPVTVFGTSIATAVATWCFIIGGLVSYYLMAKPGTLAILAGSLIGMFFIVLALLPVCTRYGIDSVTSVRPQFGVQGSLLTVVIIFAVTLGWNLILFIFLGRATTSIFRGLGLEVPGWVTGTAAAVGVIVVLVALWPGPHRLRDLGIPIATMTLIFGAAVMALLLHHLGPGTLLTAPPVAPAPDAPTNWASGLEVLIAANLSWWAYTGGIVRNGTSARSSLWSVVIGLGLGVGIGSLAGFYAGLVIPASGGDPTQFLVEVGGPVIGILLLLFIIIADLGTALVGVFAATIALRQVPTRLVGSWQRSVLLASLPALVMAGLFPNAVYDHFSTFLAFLGVCLGPICGIQIVDFFLLRRQRLHVASLYDFSPTGDYRFWFGWNPVALVAFAAGVMTYLALLNPVTYESHGFFAYTTASVPSVVVGGAVYWLGTVLIVRPAGKGGYPSHRLSDDPPSESSSRLPSSRRLEPTLDDQH
jgi:NCS1 family nucleobase:cation symporter-1